MTVLAAEALSVRTADGTPILSDVTLAIEPGETVLVCGSPGSGKTLLAKALRGLLADRDDLAVSGSVRRNGEVGFVFQTPSTQLVRRLVRRDVAFGLENRGVAVPEIEERIERYAEQLDVTHLLDREVRGLSGGETAKVALLGVLVTEPDVVLLDEPLASLDYPNTNLVLDALDRLHETGTAVVVAEHDLRDLLHRADRVLLLDDGEAAARGQPAEVVRSLYRAGVKLPFDTEIAIESDTTGNASVPLSGEERTRIRESDSESEVDSR